MGFWYKIGIGGIAAAVIVIIFCTVYPVAPQGEVYSEQKNEVPQKEGPTTVSFKSSNFVVKSVIRGDEASWKTSQALPVIQEQQETDISNNTENNHEKGKARIMKEVKWFSNASISLENRRERLKEFASKGDARSVAFLKAVGDAELYVNRYAVEELGNVKTIELHPEINQYLTQKLTDNDALLVCASVKAMGNLMGEEAVPQLADTIRKNRTRTDGHEDMVCTAAVEAISKIGSKKGINVLTEELKRSNEKGWDLEYGSKIVTALSAIGTREGLKEITAYADRLAKQIPDDPMASAYYKRKIEEARKAASQQ